MFICVELVEHVFHLHSLASKSGYVLSGKEAWLKKLVYTRHTYTCIGLFNRNCIPSKWISASLVMRTYNRKITDTANDLEI